MQWHMFVLVFVAFIIAGCESQNKTQAPVDESRDVGAPTTFTGRLQSGVVAIGGEHTGWIIAGDGGAGGFEVDVSRVREAARANDGKRVTIAGKVINRNYTERGKVPVIVVDSIKPAEKPGMNNAAGKAVG